MHTRTLSRFLPLVSALLSAACVHAGDLSIDVKLPDQRQGEVRAALFDKADSFPRGSALRTATALAIDGKATLQFADLPPGDYAVTAYLDENNNTRLDSNVFGLPTEPYGFSRNARALTGPPAFADAAVRVDSGVMQQTFDLK